MYVRTTQYIFSTPPPTSHSKCRMDAVPRLLGSLQSPGCSSSWPVTLSPQGEEGGPDRPFSYLIKRQPRIFCADVPLTFLV